MAVIGSIAGAQLAAATSRTWLRGRSKAGLVPRVAGAVQPRGFADAIKAAGARHAGDFGEISDRLGPLRGQAGQGAAATATALLQEERAQVKQALQHAIRLPGPQAERHLGTAVDGFAARLEGLLEKATEGLQQPVGAPSWQPTRGSMRTSEGMVSSGVEVKSLLRAGLEGAGCSSIVELSMIRAGEHGLSSQLPARGGELQVWTDSSGHLHWVVPDIRRLSELARNKGSAAAVLESLLRHSAGREDSFFVDQHAQLTVGYKFGPLDTAALSSPSDLTRELQDSLTMFQRHTEAVVAACSASAGAVPQIQGAVPQLQGVSGLAAHTIKAKNDAGAVDVDDIGFEQLRPIDTRGASTLRVPEEAATQQLKETKQKGIQAPNASTRKEAMPTQALDEVAATKPGWGWGTKSVAAPATAAAAAMTATASALPAAATLAAERANDAATGQLDSVDQPKAVSPTAGGPGVADQAPGLRPAAADPDGASFVEQSASCPDLRLRDFVEVQREDKEWHSGMLEKIQPNGTCTVLLDGSGASLDCCLDQLRLHPSRASLSRLVVGQRLQGKVKKVTSMGAFVDVRSDRHGLVRSSRMADHYVDRVEDYVSVGQEVDVWVYRLPQDGKLGLSMVEYPRCSIRDPVATFSAALPADWFDGVARFHHHGLHVDVDAPGGGKVQGFVPKRLVGGSPTSGQTVRVRVLRVHMSSGTLLLSMQKAGSDEAT